MSFLILFWILFRPAWSLTQQDFWAYAGNDKALILKLETGSCVICKDLDSTWEKLDYDFTDIEFLTGNYSHFDHIFPGYSTDAKPLIVYAQPRTDSFHDFRYVFKCIILWVTFVFRVYDETIYGSLTGTETDESRVSAFLQSHPGNSSTFFPRKCLYNNIYV